MEFIFEMKGLLKSYLGDLVVKWHGELSRFVCYYKCMGFFFFKKFPMNENEEAKLLGVIHILLQLQVERA